jgi:hypothetical protein
VLAVASLALALLWTMPRAAHAEPAFGDSDWVAPTLPDEAGDPAEPGPRVAKADHDKTGETILRAPFRLAFLPLRLVARGAEFLIGKSDATIAPAVGHAPKPAYRIEPIFNTDPGIGVRMTRNLDPQGDSKVFLTGIYGWHDRRKAKLTYRSATDDAPLGVHVDATYGFRPNNTFYGVGNESEKGEKSIWLKEEGRLDAYLHLGRPVLRELRVLGSLSQVSARRGFNGPPDILRVEDQFTPAEVPFLQRSSRVWSYGLGADVALLDEVRAPHRGVHLKGVAEQFRAADDSDLEYRRFHTEARAYVPLFSDRRVLAFRALHHWVDPNSGSAPIPYYRLPESNGDLRFNGYSSHRFADNHLVIGQVEYRWWITNKIYALLNANVGEVASTARRLRWADKHEAYGTGFRYGFSDRFAARVDAAKGSEGLVLNFTLEDSF